MLTISFFNILATVINILVLYLIVQKFLMKPMQNILEKREKLIQSNFEEARSAEADAKQLKAQYEESLMSAHEESLAIIDKAKVSAQAEYDNIVAQADEKAQKIVAKAHADMAIEKEQALKEVRNEVGDLIAMAVGKVAANNVSEETDKRFIEQFLADAESEK